MSRRVKMSQELQLTQAELRALKSLYEREVDDHNEFCRQRYMDNSCVTDFVSSISLLRKLMNGVD